MKVITFVVLLLLCTFSESDEEPNNPALRWGGGHGGGIMPAIHNLVSRRDDIERTVTDTTNGVTTYTWSEDPQVEEWIKTHAATMTALVHDGGRIRAWDPLFRALFDHRDDITVELENTDKGVRAALEGSTPCARSLIDMHADVISDFIELGWDEIHESHGVPAGC